MGKYQSDGNLCTRSFSNPIHPKSARQCKKQITAGAAIFPWILAQAQILDRISIPLSAWPIIFRGEAAKLEQNG